MVDVAEVKIWGELVGAVRWNQNRKLTSFQYDKKFLDSNWNISPIKMPLINGDRIYSFPELLPSKNSKEDTFQGLPGLLADSLPDKYGNQLINAWLAEQGRAPNSMNPVERLCFIGTRGMGALEFQPAQFKKATNTFDIEVDSLVELSKKILNKREAFHVNLNNDEKEALNHILKVGTSAGGMRAKAIISNNAYIEIALS